MNEFYENLKKDAQHNPTVVVAVIAGLLTAGAKFIEAVAHHKGANAFDRDSRRRERQSKKK